MTSRETFKFILDLHTKIIKIYAKLSILIKSILFLDTQNSKLSFYKADYDRMIKNLLLFLENEIEEIS